MSAASAIAVQRSAEEKQVAEEDVRWQPLLGLYCHLAVDIPLPGFKVSDFLSLRPGTVVNTGLSIAKDVPLRANGTLIAWGELEAVGNCLALRVTELA